VTRGSSGAGIDAGGGVCVGVAGATASCADTPVANEPVASRQASPPRRQLDGANDLGLGGFDM
jgi:hypothetical protein